jgi:hypothetical protein
MNRAYIVLTVWVLIISGRLPLMAQSKAGGVVPRLVNYFGKAVDAQGKTSRASPVLRSPFIRTKQTGPRWSSKLRTCRRTRELNYAVPLGATQPDGLAFESADSQIVRLALIMLPLCICK